MEDISKLSSGFQIINLVLLESHFFRINNVVFEGKIENNMNINTDVVVDGATITVTEEAIITQKFKSVEQVKINVKMVGIFERTGDTKIKDLDEFGRINGAAIIFPYIREHVTSLSLKAGIGAMILPPVNFTKTEKTY